MTIKKYLSFGVLSIASSLLYTGAAHASNLSEVCNLATAGNPQVALKVFIYKNNADKALSQCTEAANKLEGSTTDKLSCVSGPTYMVHHDFGSEIGFNNYWDTHGEITLFKTTEMSEADLIKSHCDTLLKCEQGLSNLADIQQVEEAYQTLKCQ
jgi:hypothetical protein